MNCSFNKSPWLLLNSSQCSVLSKYLQWMKKHSFRWPRLSLGPPHLTAGPSPTGLFSLRRAASLPLTHSYATATAVPTRSFLGTFMLKCLCGATLRTITLLPGLKGSLQPGPFLPLPSCLLALPPAQPVLLAVPRMFCVPFLADSSA